MKTNLTLFALLFVASFGFSQGLSLPYNTGFDTPAEQAGWEQYRTGFLSLYDWGIGGGGFSQNCLSHDYNVGGNPQDTVVDWFVSPPMNFTSPGQMSLKVRTSGFSTPFPDNFEIWFGTNDPDPETGNFELVANLSFMLPQFTWLDTLIQLPFVSDSGFIAFKYKTIGAAWSTYAVDNISIDVLSAIPGEDGNPESVSLKAFPNPFHSSVAIEISREVTDADLELYDLYGRKVRTMSGISGGRVRLDREELKGGMYFLYLKQGHKIIAADKLIITD